MGPFARAWWFVAVGGLIACQTDPVVVDAGPPQEVDEGAPVTLDGASTPLDDGATVRWTQVSGPEVALDGETSEDATFAAPAVATDTLLVFALDRLVDGDVVATDETSVLVRTTNTAPTVAAGADQAVDEGAAVAIAGTATDGDGVVASTRWVQVAGPTVTLSDPAALAPTFTAPATTAAVGLVFRLEATDDDGAVGSDEVLVAVSPVNAAPTADAGPDQVVPEQQVVTLAGAASDADGSVASTSWVQTLGDPVVLSDAAALAPTFQAPATGTGLTLAFRLEARDDEGALAVDEVVVSVATTNTPPTVDAGPHQAVDEGETVTLNGVAGDTDGTLVSKLWTQIAGPGVALADAAATVTTFTAPATSAPIALGFRLDAADDDGAHESDTTWVTVAPLNAPPTADAGDDLEVDEGDAVLLAGEAADPDGAVAGILWAQVSGPAVTLDDDAIEGPAFTAPAVSRVESLVFEMRVTDDEGAVATDAVVVRVSPLNAPPTADAGADQGVVEGDTVTLAGEASDADGAVASTTWTQLSGPSVTLDDPAILAPSFVAPAVAFPATLIFALEVEDDEGATDVDQVTVAVDPLVPVNQPPVAWAGADQAVASGSGVALSGAASDADGTVASTTWTQVGGPTVALTGAGTLSPSFTAPVVACAVLLVFEIEAVDDDGAEATDRVSVFVDGPTAGGMAVGDVLDLEATDGGIVEEGSLWAWGVPTTGPLGAWSGTRVWATNLGGNYTANKLETTCLPPIDRSGATDPILSFRAYLRLNSGDGFVVEGLDPDVGWVPLTDAEPATSRTAGGRPSWATTGATATWWLHAVRLPAWLGETARVRLVFSSDANWEDLVVYLDEIRVDDEVTDPDQDGLVGVLGEWLDHGTDPFVPDVDGDGALDGEDPDPTNPADFPGQQAVAAGFLLDFEADDGGLIPDDPTWQVGTPASGPVKAFSGTSAWATVLAGTYKANRRAHLYLPPIDLSGTTSPTLAARLWLSGNSGDGLSVEVRDADTGEWKQVAADVPAYESTDALGRPAWRSRGYRLDYLPIALSLADHAGETVFLRLAFRTDGAWEATGAYLDDLAVYDETDDPDADGSPGILQELLAGTDPFQADTDADGALDGNEADAGTDPLDPAWYAGGPTLVPGDHLTFEDDDGGLATTGPLWRHGVFASGPNAGWSGSQGWATNLSGNYADDYREFVYLPPVDLAAGDATLSFRLWLTGNSGDGLSIERWTGSTWATLVPDVPAYESVDALSKPAWRNQVSRGDYVWAAVSLADYAGQTVRLRFAFRSDGGWVASGAYLDDLALDLETSDPDDDGVIGVLGEFLAHGTDPYQADSDFDGHDDGDEVAAGTDPLNAAHHPDATALAPGDWLDFELDGGGLVPDGSGWQLGNPGSGPGGATSGSRVWATNLGGPYGDNWREGLWLPPVDLEALTGTDRPTLSFRLWMDGNNGDGVGVDAQDEQGAWTRVLADAPLPYESTDALGVVAFREQRDGTSYRLVTLDLSDWNGRALPVRLMFRSDGGWTAPGAYVDDVRLDLEADDPDGDGLSGVADERRTHGTDPYRADTDGDGHDDGTEVGAATDPLDPASHP